MKINIIVNLQFEAVHHWIKANETDSVSFLQHPHRHLFFIEAKKEVAHADREIEIISLKREIENYLLKLYPKKNIHQTSCEQLAILLLNKFNLVYCKVLEDNENGAEILA